MTTKNFVAIKNLEMYKCIKFHTSAPKLQGDIQRSNNLYLIKALFVVPVLNCTEIDKFFCGGYDHAFKLAIIMVHAY